MAVVDVINLMLIVNFSALLIQKTKLTHRHSTNLQNATLVVTKRKLAYDVLQYLYKDSSIYLNRKYELYKKSNILWEYLNIT